MTPLFTKLNLKDQPAMLVLNSPPSFAGELAGLSYVSIVQQVSKISTIAFAIIFVRTVREVEVAAAKVLPKAPGDPIIWFAYPKGTSKRFHCEFNRDTGWTAVQAAGSIDQDWTGLRFRRVAFIKTTGSTAGTTAAKLKKTKQPAPVENSDKVKL